MPEVFRKVLSGGDQRQVRHRTQATDRALFKLESHIIEGVERRRVTGAFVAFEGLAEHPTPDAAGRTLSAGLVFEEHALQWAASAMSTVSLSTTTPALPNIEPTFERDLKSSGTVRADMGRNPADAPPGENARGVPR